VLFFVCRGDGREPERQGEPQGVPLRHGQVGGSRDRRRWHRQRDFSAVVISGGQNCKRQLNLWSNFSFIYIVTPSSNGFGNNVLACKIIKIAITQFTKIHHGCMRTLPCHPRETHPLLKVFLEVRRSEIGRGSSLHRRQERRRAQTCRARAAPLAALLSVSRR
jgi:hypothetical protein